MADQSIKDAISTREQLITALENVRSIEVHARDNYMNDIITFHNVEILDTIKDIKIDEDKHIALLEELLKMLMKTF